MWIKLNVDVFDDRKIKFIRKLPNGNDICLVWFMLLCTAGKCNAGGMIHLTEKIPYTPVMLASEFEYDVELVESAIDALEMLGMISVHDDLQIEVTNWAKHQNVEGMERAKEQNRNRQKRYRESKKEQSNVTDNVTVTLHNATDKDKEEDKDIDKRINTYAESDVIEPPQDFADVSPIVLSNGKDFIADKKFVDEMKKAYPAVDIQMEFRKMNAWCISNPSNRKTSRGIKKFINGWLGRAQDNASKYKSKNVVPAYIKNDVVTDDTPLSTEEQESLMAMLERNS